MCTLGWLWRWEAEGRRCHGKADGQGQARPDGLSEHVLPLSGPCMHLKGGAQTCVFLRDDDRLQVGLALWVVGSCLFVPLGLSRDPRKEGPWQVVQEGLWTPQAKMGPPELSQVRQPLGCWALGAAADQIHAVGTAQRVSICRGRAGGEEQNTAGVACDPEALALDRSLPRTTCDI